ncbi:hypothetical protein CSOJ01_09634 [Colletotrichum sojae]|uniref:Uncharacterized protein n=1 Tax=Colletotrichum sojae TaxID=2175907 RepID=A0A8H6J2S7_9PEZI|nr:hypothetical protein CSOJ01_09634 [Colletotrichum sojae]
MQWFTYEREFNNLVQGIKRLYDGVLSQSIADSSVLSALKPHAVTVLRAAVALRPIRLERKFSPFMIGGASYGRRQKINAAGAFTIFQTRFCSRPHDRIAIMANMCGYDIRLDTRAVKERGGSLPDHGSKDDEKAPPSAASETTLLQPFNASAHLIHYNIADAGDLIRYRLTAHLRAHDVRRPGLNFPSHVWKVENELDLSILKYQWEESWQRLKTAQDDEERTTSVGQDGEEVRRNTCLFPAFVQRNDSAHTQLAQILFSILRYLYDLSLSENAMAAGVANSTWHSIRCGELHEPPLPDDVGPDLFDHPLVATTPFKALQLDPSPDEQTYNQLWFVERIMATGSLWIGRYTQVDEPIAFGKPPIEKTGDEGRPKSIIRRQLIFGMMASNMHAVSQDSDGAALDRFPPGMARNQAVNFAYMVLINPWSLEAEAKRVQNLVSVFDVDKPCLVTTAYEADWEVLPRPGIRSLRTSWVVERIAEDRISSEEDKIEEHENKKEEDSAGRRNVGIGLTARQGTNQGTHLYRVVDKVKGLWEIIEAPEKAHYFI